ncbi:hypothetical protein B0T21DRAFT_363727 [Apiosordaria backusii]|uniref:Uncharacterized protein n=1 Tax=Apiosordaria backusii TaxID=314023 RepID=A0AA40EH53_9PEZI|nr:hypothetical protein B0T21DRAFT_363727 [Apiosordaria backusii]
MLCIGNLRRRLILIFGQFTHGEPDLRVESSCVLDIGAVSCVTRLGGSCADLGHRASLVVVLQSSYETVFIQGNN